MRKFWIGAVLLFSLLLLLAACSGDGKESWIIMAEETVKTVKRKFPSGMQ